MDNRRQRKLNISSKRRNEKIVNEYDADNYVGRNKVPNFSTTCEGPSAREENLGRLSPDLQGLTRSLSESPGLHRSEVITHVDHR